MVSGIAGAIGFMFLVAAFRIAKPVIIAPFEYSYVLMALIVDIVFWSLVPDIYISLGVTLILICGIIQWWQSNLDDSKEHKNL
jgi:drug/metabolite transporter (DMT)-like permease